MKKTTLFLSLFLIAFTSISNAQVLLNEDFSTYTLGNVGSDLTGVTPGQGDWTTYIAASGANSDFQIVDDAGNYRLQITGSATAANTRWLTKDMTTLWASRDAGSDIIQVEYDYYTGPATTSKNSQRVVLYDATGTIMIAGAMVTMNTLELRALAYYDNAGTPGNYSFGLGATATSPVLLAPDTWYRIGFSFDYNTGDVIIREETTGTDALIPGAATGIDVDNVNFLIGAGTGNTVASVAKFDNLNILTTDADSLLGVKSNTVIADNFSVYPNPTKDVVNVSIADASINNVELTDLNGRVVKSNTFAGLNAVQVTTSDLAQGVYMMKISSDKGTVTKKLIKE